MPRKGEYGYSGEPAAGSGAKGTGPSVTVGNRALGTIFPLHADDPFSHGDAFPRLVRQVDTALLGQPQGTGSQSLLWFSPYYVGNLMTDQQRAAFDGHTWIGVYATDHDTDRGGVRFASAPDAVGPWFKRNADGSLVNGTGDPYGPNGTALFDGGANSQTETPSLVYVSDDPDGRPWYCFAQVQGDAEGQVTKLWTSANLINWTAEATKLSMWGAPVAKQGKLYQLSSDETQTSFRHAGYFAPFRVAGQWYAYSLYGSASGAFAVWASPDCRRWMMDRRPIRANTRWVGDDNNLSFPQGECVMLHGQLYRVGRVNNFTSGGGGSNGRLVAYRIASNLRQVIGKPLDLLTLNQGTETTDLRGVRMAIGPDRRSYVFYQTADAALRGRVHVATLEPTA